MLYLWVVGFISILGQTVLLRELNVALYGVDLIYLLALGTWLLWSAAGSMVSRRRWHPSPDLIGRLLILFSILLILDVAFVRSIRLLFSAVPGAFLPFHLQILSMSISLLPIGLLSGLLFQKTAAMYLAEQHSLARAYAVESVGGLVGGLWATVSLKLGMQNLAVAILCSLAAVAATLFSSRKERARLRPAIPVLTCCLLLAVLAKSNVLDGAMTAWTHPQLVESRDSPYSRVTITRSGDQVSVFENDALSFETEGTAAEEFVHLAALQNPDPERVLLLGGGIEGGVKEILQHRPMLVDYVELNAVLLAMVRPYLSPDVKKALNAEGVTVKTDDPRRFLDAAQEYDLILAGMPEPTSGQANRYYTAEFFRQCARRLPRAGVLAFRIPSAENLWTPQLTRRNASIYWALKTAFADVVVLPGVSNLYLASAAPLPRDPEILVARFDSRGIRSRIVSGPYIRYLYRNDRFTQVARTLGENRLNANTDEQPVCYQYTAVLWLSKFFPRLAMLDLSLLWPADEGFPRILWVPALLLLALFLAGRSRTLIRRVLLAGVAGFIGMALETLLILHYQVKSGVLYQDIGALLMCFMAGLALGAFAVDKHSTLPFRGLRTLRSWGAFLLAGFVLLSLVIGYRVRAGSMGGQAETAILLSFTGFLVAGVFAFASLHEVKDQRVVIAPLYCADLIGGCVGCLASSLILIPLAGLSFTALLMSPLSLLSVLLLRGSK
jgi:spermidine synthase